MGTAIENLRGPQYQSIQGLLEITDLPGCAANMQP
jgi:hypothetical protein